MFKPKTIYAENVDGLVLEGVKLILKNGYKISPASGNALQVDDVNFVLLNSQRRLHTLRQPEAIRYLAAEFLVYLAGTLYGKEMSAASKYWLSLSDESGKINSNYGFYTFYQKTPANMSQYDWCIKVLLQNLYTRRAIININSINHKTSTKDFPCAIALQFMVEDNALCCKAFCRSTDIIWGLPFDIGFFSFLTELLWADLKSRGYNSLELGYTAIKTNFTQIYDKTMNKANQVLSNANLAPTYDLMPIINNASEVVEDIKFHGKSLLYFPKVKSEILKWCMQTCIDIPKD